MSIFSNNLDFLELNLLFNCNIYDFAVEMLVHFVQFKDFMFTDSHCHIDFPDLYARLPEVLDQMQAQNVSRVLAVSVDIKDWARIQSLIESYPHIYGSVGTHPDYSEVYEPSVEDLLSMLQHPKVIATGETGLDYHWTKNEGAVLDWQRARFVNHIRAAKLAQKPLIIHTRDSFEDTLRIMRDEGAGEIGGVMHCFTESKEVARAALDQGFYISFSGIVSFKSAKLVHETVQYVPMDRILIETDAPYLAPVPHRGQQNEPAFVPYVAQAVASLRGLRVEQVGEITSANFDRCFRLS